MQKDILYAASFADILGDDVGDSTVFTIIIFCVEGTLSKTEFLH